jgi:tRNA(Ile)-lysidine synthetase-like protein
VTKWLLERVDSFPKNQRFIFGQRLADHAIGILELLVDAAYSPVKAALLAEASRRIGPPLVVRSPQPGERLQPLGAPGSKKLSDFFIDAKVPPEERQRAVVLYDQQGPVWVIGYRIDHRVRLTSDTRQTVKITAKPRQLRS